MCREALPPSVLPWTCRCWGLAGFLWWAFPSVLEQGSPLVFLSTHKSLLDGFLLPFVLFSQGLGVVRVALDSRTCSPALRYDGGGGGPSCRSGMEVILPSQPVFSYGSPAYSLKWKEGYGSPSQGCFKYLNRQALILTGLCRPLGSAPPSEPLFIRLCPVLTELY